MKLALRVTLLIALPYQEIIRRLEALDKQLNQPDCDDPAKAEWMRAVEDRLDKLEGLDK